ncbi:MAG: nuclear protein 96-domain-containing protein [Benniella sp.]|nr:MAG: nuclear protein 96-domain-containing protein [Benniella sp.]
MFSAFGGGGGGFGGQQQQQPGGFGTGQSTFGSTSSFGAPSTGFGAAANPAFGGNTQSSGFGGAPAGGFGSNATSTGFGAGGFGGASSGFGAQASQPGFGSSAFGASATSNPAGGFGAFGSSSAPTSGFGGSSAFGAKPATTGFGTQPSSGFGTTTNTGFGGASNAFGGGMLGGGMNQPAGTGTVNPPFAPFVEKEPATGQNSHYQSITAMPAYRGYSFEELRLQDYQQGRKFPGQAPGFGATGGFGQQQQQQTASSAFGAQPSAFGATNSTTSLSGFGSGSTGFGGTTTGFGSTPGFGTTTPASSGFGAQATAPTSGFGSTSGGFGTQPTTGGFGTGAGTGGFGFGASSAAKPAGGFGFGATATSQPAGGFGTTSSGFGASTTTPGLFGGTATGSTSTFGAPATSTTPGFGTFGATQTSAAPGSTGLGFGLGGGTSTFGAAKPATTSLFGNPATSTATTPAFGSFGSSSTTGTGGLFGATPSGSSLFPAASAPSTNLFGGTGTTAAPAFGASTASTGLFGANKPATTGGLFASTPSTGFGATSTFGTAGAAPTTSLFGGAGTTGSAFGASTLGGGLLGASTLSAPAQPAMVASVNGSIYGDNPLFKRDTTAPASKSQPAVLSRPEPAQKLPALIPPVRFNPRHSQIRLRPTSTATFSSSVSGGELASGRKSLLLLDGINDDSGFSSDDYTPRRSVKKLQLNPRGQETDQPSSQTQEFPRSGVTFNPALESSAALSLSRSHSGLERTNSTNGRPADNQASANRHDIPSSSAIGDKAEGEYWMSPSLEELKKMSRSELQHISDFKVGLPGYGSVDFLQPVDLSTLPLTSICGHTVVFSRKLCTVYPDEHTKPPRGQGMNVPALVSLEGCWPTDRSTREPVRFDRSSPQYAQHVKRLKRQTDTTFMDFNTDNGTWTFRVEHFSQYGLSDEEADTDMTSEDNGRRVISTSATTRHVFGNSSSNSSSTESDDNVKYYEDAPSEPASTRNMSSLSTSRFSRSGDPQRQNMMRTSLFADAQPQRDRISKRSSVWSTSSENSEQPEFAGERAGGLGAETRPSFQQDYDAGVSMLRRPPRKYTRSMLYEQSLLTRKGNLLADAGLMMGRSFRVGWGPNGTLAVCGAICSFKNVMERVNRDEVAQLPGAQQISPTSVQLVKVNVVAAAEETEVLRHLVSLQALLRNTAITLNQKNEPKASIVPGTTFTVLMDHLKELNHNLSSEETYAWILGQSLFDPQPTPPNILEMSETAQEAYEAIGRRVRCSNWLSYVTKPLLDADLKRLEAGGGPTAQDEIIFTLLLNNKRQKASMASIRAKNLRLATLISQSGRGSRSLIGVEEQLAIYMKANAQDRIPTGYLKVYALLSGELKVNVATKGEPIRTVTDGLDWRRTFGLYLWHSSTPGTNLREAVEQYTVSMSQSRMVAKPYPWYKKGIYGQDPKHYDFLFHLIALSTMPSKNLEDTLHPLGMTPACIDYRQSWLFYMVLTQSLHVGRFRSEATHTKICQDFMFQLENLGLWEWAVFVALHLEPAEAREMIVRQLLERHVELPMVFSDASMDLSEAGIDRWEQACEKTTFLHQTLKIPMEWIWIARATRAKYLGDLTWEVFSLLRGGEHQEGHRLILSQLAPACILRGQLDTLRHILGMIDHSKVPGWETGGSIYKQYVESCSDFEVSIGRLKQKSKRVSYSSDLTPTEDVQTLQDNVQQLVMKLPLLLGQKAGVSPELEVCVADMASKCTKLLRYLKDLTIQESAALTDLPLTEDQRMSAVQKISSDYFDEILTGAEETSVF